MMCEDALFVVAQIIWLRLALERKEKEDILNDQRLLDGEKGEGPPSQEASEKGGTSTSVQGLLEEATKVLKRISTATPGLKKGVSSQNPQRDEMMPNLQQQLDQLRESTTSMKVMRLGRLVRNDSGGLLDSRATHPLRPRGDDEDESRLRSVEVVLADGAKKQLHMTSGGTMLSHHQEVEALNYGAGLQRNLWEGQNAQVEHPMRGRLKVSYGESKVGPGAD